MRKLIYLLPLLFALIVSCEGPQGPEGPRGPQGAQGPAGTDGTDGADGQDGADGSANVTSFVVSYSASNASYNSNSTIAWVRFNTDAITSSNVEEVAVMAYFDTGVWTALPLNNYSPDVEITYSYQPGVLEVDFFSKDGSAITQNEIPEQDVKFTIIPPTSSPKINPTDWNNRVKEPGLLSKQYN